MRKIVHQSRTVYWRLGSVGWLEFVESAETAGATGSPEASEALSPDPPSLWVVKRNEASRNPRRTTGNTLSTYGEYGCPSETEMHMSDGYRLKSGTYGYSRGPVGSAPLIGRSGRRGGSSGLLLP
mgnify:CR=1 FL=1